MTQPTDIKALEEAVKFFDENLQHAPNVNGYFNSLSDAAQTLLQLLKGEHETDVIVPREPTDKMSDKGEFVNSEWLNDNAPLGQASYRTPAKVVYKSMIQAAQEGQG